MVLADMGFDMQAHRLTQTGQRLPGPNRAIDQIANAPDIDDQGILACGIERAGQLCNHERVSAGVSAQRLNSNGDRLWGPNGASVVDLNSNYDYLDLNIAVFGDYDVDGATSSALIYRYFLSIGIKIRIYIPDRLLLHMKLKTSKR